MKSLNKLNNSYIPLSLPWKFRWFIFIAIIAKLILTANEEIIAYDLPHDDFWQICSAENWYFFGNYKWNTLLHLPIYPFFIKLVSQIGVPLRVATELLFCGSAWLLSVALWHLGCTPFIAGLAGLSALYHPASFQLPNRAGAEILLAPLLIGAIASSILWWTNRDKQGQWRYSAFSSILWALACNVRRESILLFGFLALFALIVIITDRNIGRKRLFGRISYGIIVPISAALLLSFVIKGGNYLRWGIFTDSILTAPGYTAAYRALQSIPPSKRLDFIAVPVEVRERAYLISPSFTELRPYLEGGVGAGWANISRTSFTNPMGMKELDKLEIASGWFYWALHDAAIAAGYTQAQQEDLFFKKVADQINQAQDSGLLKRRFVPIAFIDPAWQNWLPRLPESFGKVSRLLSNPAVLDRLQYDATNTRMIINRFDQTANRRRHLLNPPTASVGGWVTSSDESSISLSIKTLSNRLVTQTVPTIMRPDVNTKLPVGFNLEAQGPSLWDWNSSQLVIFVDNQEKFAIPLNELKIGKVIPRSIGNNIINIGIDRAAAPVLSQHWTWNIQSSLERRYLQVTKKASWLLILVPLALMWLWFKKRPFPSAIVAVALFSAIILERLLFFAILDASSWPGNQPRYIYPIMPLFGALLVLVVALVATACFPVLETLCWRKRSTTIIKNI